MKKLLSVAVGMAVLGFVAGCGDGSDEESAPTGTQPSSQPTIVTTLPNLGPEPPDQRPSNGDIVVRSGSFDQGFGRNEAWQIDLQPSSLGNASTSEVDAY